MSLKRKISTFSREPIGSTIDRAKTMLLRLCDDLSKKRLTESGALEFVTEFVLKRPVNGIRPDFTDLGFLYRQVRRRKPSVVLEFGSGCSTVVLAKALLDNAREGRRGYLYSIDADPYWADSTASSIPACLKPYCEVIYSPLTEADYDGVLCLRHKQIPAIQPNFIYLDGPPLTLERDVAIDILDMEDRFPPGFFLVIDGRKANTQFLKKHLKRNYRFKDRKLFFNSVFSLVS